MSILFDNNASATLSVQAEIVDTTLTLQTNEGQLFPAPTGGDFFQVTLEDTSGNIEITQCTGRTNDVLTVTRARENTTAKVFPVGSKVELRTTAGVFNEFIQRTGGVMTGTLDMNGEILQDAVITSTGSAAIQNVPIRGADNGTANQILVPSAGADPTIGAAAILTVNNGVPSTRTLTGGTAIATIGDLSTNRTIDLDIDELTTMEGNALAATSKALVYDAGTHKTISYQDAGARVITESTTNRTFAAGDMNTYVRFTNGSASTATINTSVGVTGNYIAIEQAGAGTVSIAGSATVNSAFALDQTRAANSVVVLFCTSANTWTLFGDAS
jgi:hypothetical protein